MKNKKKRSLGQYADGGVAGVSTWANIAGAIPNLSDNLMSLLENNPNAYSKQPLINPDVARSSFTPYAYGTGPEGVDDNTMQQLQTLADQQGITVDELIQMLQNGELQDTGEDSTGQEQETDQEDTEGDETDDEEGFAYGGKAGTANINVEGDETLETPAGKVKQMKGPKHSSGGIDVNVPKGTKIFSDRIKVDGKTMSERKLKRERTLKRINKMLEVNPSDKAAKNTLKRTTQVHAMEEAEDMSIQNAVSRLHDPKRFAGGGIVGDDEDPYTSYMNSILGLGPNRMNVINPPYAPGYTPSIKADTLAGTRPVVNINPTTTAKVPRIPGLPTGAPSSEPESFTGALTLGDKIGIGGNLFNAIAPIINTHNNRFASKPNVNRFLGFGHDALATNDAAQHYIDTQRDNANTDIDASANASIARNRNGATDVNTARALDIATDMGKNKAKNAVNDSFSREMMNILGQKSQLEMGRDKVVMTGEAQRDIEDKADTDNFYSNMASNLTNFGTNVQGIGRSLNVRHSNIVDAKLLSQLSQYGLGFDDNGQLISIK
jgi:hypothetical protein